MSAPLFDAHERSRLDRLRVGRRRILPGVRMGDWRSGRIGSGGLFADHREYVVGDDLRYVDWNVYGRLGELVVKRFEAEENLDLLLLVDRSLSMEGAKGRRARRLAGALGYIALAHLEHVRLGFLPAAPTGPVATFGNRQRAAGLLDALAGTPDEGTTDHARGVSRLLGASHRRGVAIVLSDFYDPGESTQGLARLKAHGHEVAALQIVDPADCELPLGASLEATDRETGERMRVDVTRELQARVRETWKRHGRLVQRWCVAHQVIYSRVDVRQGFWPSLRDLLRQGIVSGVATR